jgi:hypothetical protein
MFATSNKTSSTVQEEYEYYAVNVPRKLILMQGMTTQKLKNNLDPSFVRYLSNVDSKADAVNLFKMYGTHLFTGYILGGRLTSTNYRQSTSATENMETSMQLSEKVSAAIGTVIESVGESVDFSNVYGSEEGSLTMTSTYNFQVLGGTPISAMEQQHLFTYNPSAFDGKGGYVYKQWFDSIGEGVNLQILKVSDNALSVPLWELIPTDIENSYEIRSYLIEAYIELCADNIKHTTLTVNLGRSEGRIEHTIENFEIFFVVFRFRIYIVESGIITVPEVFCIVELKRLLK